MTRRQLRALAALLLALVLYLGVSHSAAHAGSAAAVVSGPQEAAASAQPQEGEAGHDAESWAPVIAKAFNFAILVALLVYFLRTPFVTYLRSRADQIRKELVDAAALRAAGERRLVDIRAQLATIPNEIADLTKRGQEELAAERVRMNEATARERQRLVDRTRREIDLQARLARRALMQQAADLSMTLARTRIEREITPDDQTRLIDRYTTEVRA